MEGHTKERDQQPDQKDGGDASRLDSAIPEIRIDTTDVPANEQSPYEVRAAQGTTSLDKSEQRMEGEVRFSGLTSVAEEEVEGKDFPEEKVKEISRKRLKKVQEEVKDTSFQDSSTVGRHSSFENIGDDTVSKPESASRVECFPSTYTKPQFENVYGRGASNFEIRESVSDRASDTATSSINTSTSSSQSSQPIAIPSTSRSLPGSEPNLNSPKRPTNLGSHPRQSIHVFDPRKSNSVLQKLAIPFRKGHNVYLRNSPESSDYGGSPDSLEDPFMMEALYSSENENEDFDTLENSEPKLCPQASIDKEEIEKPSESEPLAESLDPPSEPLAESLDPPSEPLAESLDPPSEPLAESLDPPSEPLVGSLDPPSESTKESSYKGV